MNVDGEREDRSGFVRRWLAEQGIDRGLVLNGSHKPIIVKRGAPWLSTRWLTCKTTSAPAWMIQPVSGPNAEAGMPPKRVG